MGIQARVLRTFPANDRRPDAVKWEGVLVWENPDVQDDTGRAQLVLKVQCGMRAGSNGNFLTMPQQMQATINDNGQPRMRPKTWTDRDGNTRYSPLVTLGRGLQSLGVKAVETYLKEQQSSAPSSASSSDLTGEAQQAFGDLDF